MIKAQPAAGAARTGTPHQTSRGAVIALLGLFGVLAVLLGLVGGVAGWIGMVLTLTLLVPAVLLSADYRLGLILLVVLMPYANSRFIPQLGPLSVVNMVLAGVCALYLLRMGLLKLAGRPAPLPFDRELLLFYVLPVTMAAVIGTTHLGEIPPYFLVLAKIEHYGLKEYWISQYFKTMLLVLTACIMGAAVVEYGKGQRFAIALAVSAVLFVMAMLGLIALTGMSLDRLKDARSFLGMLGIIVAYVLHYRRIKTAVTVLALVVVGAALAPAALYERLGRGLDDSVRANINSESDELTAGRVYTWKQLAPEVLRSPAWGRGQLSTQWSNHVKTTWYNASHPHNMYLEILMDMGLLGAAAMFLFYRHIWRMFRRLGADPRVPEAMRGFFIGAWAGLLSMLIYGATNGHYYPAPEQIFYWVTVGLAYGYAAWLKQQAPGEPVAQAKPAPRWRVPPERILRPLGGRPSA